MIKVIYSPKVVDYIDNLIFILFEKGYFGFPESAKTYVSKLTADIESSIHLKLKNPSPPRFKKYGSHYVTYKPNKNTTWYVFFSMRADRYLVRFITNNHVSAQHIRGL
jgi:hypothetical protein